MSGKAQDEHITSGLAATADIAQTCGQVRVVPCVTSVAGPHGDVQLYERDEGGPFEVGNQVLISSHRKLLSSKAMVVNVAEKSKRDFGRHG